MESYSTTGHVNCTTPFPMLMKRKIASNEQIRLPSKNVQNAWKLLINFHLFLQVFFPRAAYY